MSLELVQYILLFSQLCQLLVVDSPVGHHSWKRIEVRKQKHLQKTNIYITVEWPRRQAILQLTLSIQVSFKRLQCTEKVTKLKATKVLSTSTIFLPVAELGQNLEHNWITDNKQSNKCSTRISSNKNKKNPWQMQSIHVKWIRLEQSLGIFFYYIMYELLVGI